MATSAPNTRPIVIRKIRRAQHQHHGGAWKVAYADFVTAMMAFFMLLWLISNPDKERLKGLAEYFSPAAASASGSNAAGTTPGDAPGIAGRVRLMQADTTPPSGEPTVSPAAAGAARGGTAMVPDASLRVLAQELRVAVDSMPGDAGGKAAVKIDSNRDGLRISLMDTANRSMFRDGTAVLNDYARNMLARVAAGLVQSGAQIAIEGHTDGTGGQSDANWRLSGERALAARSAMIAAGLTPDRFSEVVALGATRPVYPDQPDRPENRRITVVALGQPPAAPSDVSFKF